VLVATSACSSLQGTTSPPSSASPTAASSPSSSVTTASPPAPTTSAAAPSSSVSTSTDETVQVAATADAWIHVLGRYPHVDSDCKHYEQPTLQARYPGRLVIHREDDGTLTLTLAIPFESYLDGIAEVPSSWPRAALEAQAIAARSYALASTGWQGEPGETLDTPICSTTSCQVYGGMPAGPPGRLNRWEQAVRKTRGQVLLYDGRPATTFYFSTSNGQTYGNEQVFGGTPLPYLRGVPEHDDGASPTSHWRSTVPFPDLRRFLAREDLWPADRPISSVEGNGDAITVHGGGTSSRIDGSTFRSAVNAQAPCLAPGRYPQDSLPVTIPSRWMTASSGGGQAVFTGRGWGHGVGMVQWGAYGKAKRGWSAARILGAYYGGLQPRRFREPGEIKVRIASGLRVVRIRPSEPGATVAGERFGPRQPITISGGDELVVGRAAA
jgi:SpoIID/LytB domain protein